MAAFVGMVFIAACATSETSTEKSEFVDFDAPTRASKRETLPVVAPDDFSVFAPKETTSRLNFDYTALSSMLSAVVYNLGPSTRKRPADVRPNLGTRFVSGHTSPFRLEGNRITYSILDRAVFDAMTEYKDELVAIGNQYELSSLSKNVQLAYWLNLSNVLTIETIAKNYPVKDPKKMRLGDNGERFEDVKLVTIRGVPLSLKDIRTKIVYPHWKSPEIIYGFHRGDIGGPSIKGQAFTAENVSRQLDSLAGEFVNSLRGVSQRRNMLEVSAIYEEARPYFFPSWPTDFREHLRKHMRDSVLEEVNLNAEIRIADYETRVADLAGGDTTSTVAETQAFDAIFGRSFEDQNSGIPAGAARLIREVEEKMETLRIQGRLRGRVIIEDLPDRASPLVE
ncbi:MAG: DUF547 domain-containing protein [Pseudomonadota bacterium]